MKNKKKQHQVFKSGHRSGSTTTLNIPIPFYSDRVFPDTGLSKGLPIIEAEFGLSKNNLRDNFVVDIFVVTPILNRVVINQYNNKTLIPRGTSIPPGVSKPIQRINFLPSVENIARFFFQRLDPALRKIQGNLSYVTVKLSIGSATYKRK